MDSPFLLLLIPLLIAAAAAVWFGTKPIRDIRRDPELAEQWKLPFRDRWRYGKLARQHQKTRQDDDGSLHMDSTLAEMGEFPRDPVSDHAAEFALSAEEKMT